MPSANRGGFGSHFHSLLGMTRPGNQTMTSPSQGGHSNHKATLVSKMKVNYIFNYVEYMLYYSVLFNNVPGRAIQWYLVYLLTTQRHDIINMGH